MAIIDRRAAISANEFNAIPICEEYPIDGYYEVLIDCNKRIDHEFFEDSARLKELTSGQRMLIQLGSFDSQVKNGGVTQFFWNCSEYIFDVRDWIAFLDLPLLQSNYERVRWSRFRGHGCV